MAGFRRAAVRLHPRSGAPTERDSSVGGPMLIRRDEAWPVCAADHKAYTYRSRDIVSVAGMTEPMVSGVQLWRRDVPELPFRADEDLCQVLWCPLMHGPDLEPLVLVRWLDTCVDTDLVVGSAVSSEFAVRSWEIPSPCSVSPERIKEYADASELPADVWQQVRAWCEAHGYRYGYELGPAPGTKVGGWQRWPDGSQVPLCAAGHLMSILVAVASIEYHPGSQRAWQPVGEQPDAGRTDANLHFRDNGALVVFICEACPDRPVTSIIQD